MFCDRGVYRELMKRFFLSFLSFPFVVAEEAKKKRQNEDDDFTGLWQSPKKNPKGSAFQHRTRGRARSRFD